MRLTTNFIALEAERRRRMKKIVYLITGTICVLCGVITILLVNSLMSLRLESSEIKSALALARAASPPGSALTQAEISRSNATIRQFNEVPHHFLSEVSAMLHTLETHVPASIAVQEIKWQPEKSWVEMTGQAEKVSAPVELLSALASSPSFQDILLKEQKESAAAGSDIHMFKLSARWSGPSGLAKYVSE